MWYFPLDRTQDMVYVPKLRMEKCARGRWLPGVSILSWGVAPSVTGERWIG